MIEESNQHGLCSFYKQKAPKGLFINEGKALLQLIDTDLIEL